MSTYTQNLNLFKYDVVADRKAPYNIIECLNNNWDKLDVAYGDVTTSLNNAVSTMRVDLNSTKQEVQTQLEEIKENVQAQLEETEEEVDEKLKILPTLTINGCMPDYTKAFSIPSPYTPTVDGFIYIDGWTREGSLWLGLTIDGFTMVLNASLTNREGGHYPGGMFLIGKGSTVTTGGWVTSRIFIPCKGVL